MSWNYLELIECIRLALLKERGYLPLPFTFPNNPYILQPKKVPTDIPFERYVDKLLADLKDKPPSSPESYRSSSNTVSPVPDLDLDCGLDDLVTHRRFKSFDDSEFEQIFNNYTRNRGFFHLITLSRQQKTIYKNIRIFYNEIT